MQKKAIILVDLQADFTEWKKGALSVLGTDAGYVSLVESEIRSAQRAGIKVFATQDWHPPSHISFYTSHFGKRPFDVVEVDGKRQMLWPPHCIQGTEGARIVVDNNLFLGVVQKGRDPRYDSYSGFRDDGGNKTELEDILRYHGIDSLIVFGLALDYCVKATAMDAIALGFRVSVVKGLSKGVSKDTTMDAIQEMKRAGIQIQEVLSFET